MPENRKVCDLTIDTDDLEVAGISIPKDRLGDFGEFLQEFLWDEVDLIAILKKAAEKFV